MFRFPTLLALLGTAAVPAPAPSGPAAFGAAKLALDFPSRDEVIATGNAVALSPGVDRPALDGRWSAPAGHGVGLAALIVPLAPSVAGQRPILLRWIVVRSPAASSHRA